MTQPAPPQQPVRLGAKFGESIHQLLLIAIDLAFVGAYFLLIGAAAVGLHFLTKVLEAQGLTGAELLPVVLLGHALTWVDCVGAFFAAITILAESMIGRGQVVRKALDALKR